MYDGRSAVTDRPNPINRYLIKLADCCQAEKRTIGRLTPPSTSRKDSHRARQGKANGLPAPNDADLFVMRLYWPKESAAEDPGNAQPCSGSSESVKSLARRLPSQASFGNIRVSRASLTSDVVGELKAAPTKYRAAVEASQA